MGLRRIGCLAAGGLCALIFILFGCKKNDNVLMPNAPLPLYQVRATVVDTTGNPRPGAILMLSSPPEQSGTFIATTDSGGKATIQSPPGNQLLIARYGITLQGTLTVNVQASSTTTDAGVVHLQAVAIPAKILTVITEAESLQTALRVIGFTTFDTTYADTLLAMSLRDSSALLTYLSRYSIIFSSCDDGLEAGADEAVLSRTYGRYISAGGKMFGGHCNYYHLRRIWAPYYQNYDNQEDEVRDSIRIVDSGLEAWLGFSIASWDSSTDSRRLSGYEKFLDLPPGSRVYATISWTSPQMGVIVENTLGKGKFVWTNYHSDDLVNAQGLRTIIQYFLLTM